MRTALVIPAAGSGTRLGADMPKAFVPLEGWPLLWHTVRGAVRSGVVDEIVIAAPAAKVREAARLAAEAVAAAGSDPAAGAWQGRTEVVPGGDDRIVSVAAALAVADSAERVLVHDAARCLTPAAVFGRVAAALAAGAEAVVPVLPVADTIRTLVPAGGTESGALVGGLQRAALRRVQTPQGFSRDVLVRAHELQRTAPDPAVTDDAGLVERLGVDIVPVDGDEAALKITYPIDLRIARLYLEESTA